jgi:hypothetical protein
MSTAASPTADQEIWRPKFNPWLIAVVVAMAAFMEVLDTSIANDRAPDHRLARGRGRTEEIFLALPLHVHG